MSGDTSSDALIPSYTLPPSLKAQIEKDFDGLGALSYTYIQETKPFMHIFCGYGQEGRDKERAYRALCYYAAEVIDRAMNSPEGKEFGVRFMDVISGARHGLLIKGLPSDIETKALVVLGLKTLLADNEGVKDWFEARLPQVISRAPRNEYNFHHDALPDMTSPHKRNFLLMGSAQNMKISVPTVFKLPESNVTSREINGKHMTIYFAPDEVVIADDKTLEHSTGLASNFTKIRERWRGASPRSLFRYIVRESTLTHSRDHVAYVSGLMKEAEVPTDLVALKIWLGSELEKQEKRSHD